MARDSEQVQIVKKLDRMDQKIDELEGFTKELLKRLDELEFESYYPPETKIRKSFIRNVRKAEKEIQNGKYHTYNSVKEMDEAIRKMQ
jgi:restriction endonuclease S subunit